MFYPAAQFSRGSFTRLPYLCALVLPTFLFEGPRLPPDRLGLFQPAPPSPFLKGHPITIPPYGCRFGVRSFLLTRVPLPYRLMPDVQPAPPAAFFLIPADRFAIALLLYGRCTRFLIIFLLPLPVADPYFLLPVFQPAPPAPFLIAPPNFFAMTIFSFSSFFSST
jgi:hypothetical protein